MEFLQKLVKSEIDIFDTFFITPEKYSYDDISLKGQLRVIIDVKFWSAALIIAQ